MRRTALLLAVMATTLVVASGVALAAEIVGTNRGERIIGTTRADDIEARGGDDVVRAREGADTISGGNGNDRQFGGRGNDVIDTDGGFRDEVDCGRGVDTAFVDSRDQVVRCERLR